MSGLVFNFFSVTLKDVQEQLLFNIKLITDLKDIQVSEFSTLLDEGNNWDKQQANLFFQDKNNILFIAYKDNTPVGFLTAYKLQRFDTKKREVLLYEIGVHEQYQRKGIGKALIETLKEWARKQEAFEIWVLTNKSNISATSLYSSTGATTESSDEQMFVYKL